MNYRKLGKTGVNISEISFGTEHLAKEDRDSVRELFKMAVDGGMNLIDLLPLVPEAIDSFGAAFHGIRKEFILAAHFGFTFQKGEYYKTRDPDLCEASFDDLLLRLRTDYIDILMFHWVDKELDYDEAFDRQGYLGLALRLKQEGKVRFLALSTHIAAMGMKTVRSGFMDAIMFPVNPAHDLLPGDISLELIWQKDTYRELSEEAMGPAEDRKEFYLACQESNVGLIAMKPYAGGLLLQEGNPIDHLRGRGLPPPWWHCAHTYTVPELRPVSTWGDHSPAGLPETGRARGCSGLCRGRRGRKRLQRHRCECPVEASKEMRLLRPLSSLSG